MTDCFCRCSNDLRSILRQFSNRQRSLLTSNFETNALGRSRPKHRLLALVSHYHRTKALKNATRVPRLLGRNATPFPRIRVKKCNDTPTPTTVETTAPKAAADGCSTGGGAGGRRPTSQPHRQAAVSSPVRGHHSRSFAREPPQFDTPTARSSPMLAASAGARGLFAFCAHSLCDP